MKRISFSMEAEIQDIYVRMTRIGHSVSKNCLKFRFFYLYGEIIEKTEMNDKSSKCVRERAILNENVVVENIFSDDHFFSNQ